MISESELDRIKAENPPLEVAMRHGIEAKRQGNRWLALCPFHNEGTPSFSIEADHAHCFGCGWHGDSIALEGRLSDIGFIEACRSLGAAHEDEACWDAEKLRQRQAERRQRQCEAEECALIEKRMKQNTWPKFYLGQTHDLQQVAELRRIDYAGPWLAQNLGHLRFCAYPPIDPRNSSPQDGPHRLMWVIVDRSCAQIRRLDGGLLPCGAKAQTLPGSSMHPIGLTDGSKPVIVVEGGPDYLAALARLWAVRKENAFEVVVMLGASQRFNAYARRLRGRWVTIYAHHDENGAGLKAARRWEKEATEAGATSASIFTPSQIGDLNHLAR